MLKKLIPVLALGAALAVVLVLRGGASAGIGDIFGTDHDLGVEGEVPTCNVCHIPHKAQGDYLWAMEPSSETWGDSAILPLCFSCHGGDIAGGGYILNPDYENHPIGIGFEGEDYCMKCMQPDCMKCHDPHDDAWVFLDAERFTSDYWNANVCTFCHDPESERHGLLGTHPQDEETDGTVLPAGADSTWDGDAGDFSGTPLWDATGTTDEDGGPGQLKCMTCHRPHGAHPEGGTLNSMQYIDPGSTHAPICENCHVE